MHTVEMSILYGMDYIYIYICFWLTLIKIDLLFVEISGKLFFNFSKMA